MHITHIYMYVLQMHVSLSSDAVTIVLFQVLGAFANRPLDPEIDDSERDITVADVSTAKLADGYKFC